MKRNIWLSLLLICSVCSIQAEQTIIISGQGNDSNNGSAGSPVRTFEVALQLAKNSTEKEICILFREGVYQLNSTAVITYDDFHGKKLLISSWQNERVTLKGSKAISPVWKKGKNNIYQTPSEDNFDQLYINGEKRILARYPNYEEGVLFNGTSEDALSPKRIKKWKDPTGGYIHSMHSGRWGSQHYLITGKGKDTISYEGGYQVIRDSPVHNQLRYVENIREELDSPGEWFLDKKEKILYYYPYLNEKPEELSVEIVTLPHLIELRGRDENNSLSNVTIKDICFTHTLRTILHPYESLMRSDWGIYRGAAIILENTKDCVISNCEFTDLGGNAIFLSKYNLNNSVISNHIHHIGSSAICLVGDTTAVRSGSLGYYNFVPYEEMDLTPGPKNSLYPRECTVEDNLIHDIGLIEKQVAGVQIQIAAQINVRHNTIFRIPRAGINIGDGAFGGHILEYNDVFDTVLETSDHGAFNSWGRDRYWHPNSATMHKLTQEHPDVILLDAIYTTIIRNNRFRCDHGWDIDLDDGSSNYHIYNNVCLRGGIKLREGFYRKVENNLVINSSLHPHVWFLKSGDIVQRNVFMQPYFPIQIKSWGEKVDYNFFSNQVSLDKVRKDGTDIHSISGELLFANVQKGDYTLPVGSAPFTIGFENIPMDRFGVYSPTLKAIAEQPVFPPVQLIDPTNDSKVYEWLGAGIKVIKGQGDQRNIIIVDVEEGSMIDQSGLQKNDIIRSINKKDIFTIEEVYALTEENRWRGRIQVAIYRNQNEEEKRISFR